MMLNINISLIQSGFFKFYDEKYKAIQAETFCYIFNFLGFNINWLEGCLKEDSFSWLSLLDENR